jgi:UDP:flavonoid glycosyltransferase YjiC (YdhE family)
MRGWHENPGPINNNYGQKAAMARFGVICPAATGHLNPMMTLCRELQRRHHQIVFFQLLETEAKVKAAGFECQTIGHERFPLGPFPKNFNAWENSQARKLFITLST